MNLIRETASLELGEAYPEAVSEARRFVKWLLAQRMFKANPLAGEGGFVPMVDTCLSYIVWTGTITQGIKAYYRMLAQEYDHKVETVPYEALPDNTLLLTKVGDEIEASLGGGAEASSPVEGDSPLTGRRPPPVVQTLEELELFNTLASIGGGAGKHGGGQSGGGVPEAATLIGIEPDHARTLYRRVMDRVRRRLASGARPSASMVCDP